MLASFAKLDLPLIVIIGMKKVCKQNKSSCTQKTSELEKMCEVILQQWGRIVKQRIIDSKSLKHGPIEKSDLKSGKCLNDRNPTCILFENCKRCK